MCTYVNVQAEVQGITPDLTPSSLICMSSMFRTVGFQVIAVVVKATFAEEVEVIATDALVISMVAGDVLRA